MQTNNTTDAANTTLNNSNDNSFNNIPSTMDTIQISTPNGSVTYQNFAPDLSGLPEIPETPAREGFYTVERAKNIPLSEDTATLVAAMRNLLEIEHTVFSVAGDAFFGDSDITNDLSRAFSKTRDAICKLMIDIMEDNMICPVLKEL